MAANKVLRRLIRRIEQLKNEVYRLEESFGESESYYQNQICSVKESASRQLRQADWERQQAEERIRDREYETHDLARKLQSARERGDRYDCDKYLRRLKNL